MKIIYSKLIVILAVSFSLFSCEDVIQINLNSTNPKIVLEAQINDESNVSTLKITKSTDYFNPADYKTVEGAFVTISNNAGDSKPMLDIGDGRYQTDLIKGESEIEYSIKVLIDNEEYVAKSIIPNKVIIDSLSIEESQNRFNDDEKSKRYILHIYFKDEADINNFYRVKIFVDGAPLSGFTVFQDKYTDGNDIDARFRIDNDKGEITPETIIDVELQSIDEDNYYFYKTANGVNASGSSTGGGPQSTSVAPTNPESNWSNNALGNFSAYAVSSKSIKISD